jgi:hypothetical protein
MAITIKLTEQIVFSDLNKKEGKNNDFARDAITIETLKYKHIRAALKYPESDQMHQLMIMLTGLSENDVGELLPEDAARIGILLHQELNKFNEISQNMLTPGNKS